MARFYIPITNPLSPATQKDVETEALDIFAPFPFVERSHLDIPEGTLFLVKDVRQESNDRVNPTVINLP